MSASKGWGVSDPKPGGYYLALDKVNILMPGWMGITSTEDNPRFDWDEKHTRAKFYYWNGEERSWFHEIEKAAVYGTVEEAEGQALLAVSLDQNVAGHVNILQEETCLAREKQNIDRRKNEEEQRKKHGNYRFGLRPGEGGI